MRLLIIGISIFYVLVILIASLTVQPQPLPRERTSVDALENHLKSGNYKAAENLILEMNEKSKKAQINDPFPVFTYLMLADLSEKQHKINNAENYYDQSYKALKEEDFDSPGSALIVDMMLQKKLNKEDVINSTPLNKAEKKEAFKLVQAIILYKHGRMEYNSKQYTKAHALLSQSLNLLESITTLKDAHITIMQNKVRHYKELSQTG